MRELVIEIPYYGLGDHLFHSHLPRIAKETGKYDRVYISNFSLFRNAENKALVWELNPFVDGFVDKRGVTCNLENLVKALASKGNNVTNLLDEVMLHYNLDNQKRWHEPEIYYKPVFKNIYHKTFFDPNFFSWVGTIEKEDMIRHLKHHKIELDAVLELTTVKALFTKEDNVEFVSTVSLFDYCDLIFSSKKFYCLTSGSATIAAALNKPAVVFFGKGQGTAFQHSKLHRYVRVRRSLTYRILRKIKKCL